MNRSGSGRSAPRVRRYAAGRARALGVATRGTTGANRLRRVDRWVAAMLAGRLRAAGDPLVVDLGYGASPVTTLELASRLAEVRADVRVVGIEIDRERVAAAAPLATEAVSFRHGGFELPLDGRRPVLVRAMNVLRQYDAGAVTGAWQAMAAVLAPDGVIVDGTCDEIGRRCAWFALDASATPTSLTLAAHLPSLRSPGELAERLPKALIHRNVPGEPVHALLTDFDRAWDAAVPYAPFGNRQRWVHAVRRLAAGWPVLGGPERWRLGEVTVAWGGARLVGESLP